MDTAAAPILFLEKNPTVRCSWFTLLVTYPSENSSIRGVSYLGRENFSGEKKITGL